jgi:pilus assembly protein CpaB
LKRSNRLVLLIGVFLAVVAFVLIILLLGGGGTGNQGNQATPPANKTVVIAATDIPLGASVTEEMLTTQELPVTSVNPGAFENPSQVIGQVVRTPVIAGAQITTQTFSGGNQFTVPAGQRAMAVQVDAVSGVGTAIQAGDYVDLIIGLTGDAFPVVQLNPDDGSISTVAGLNNTSVKVLIEGMQVLATAHQTTAEQAPPPEGASPTPDSGLSQGDQELVVLSVTAQQAELIKYAQLQGSISLVLRSAADFFDENGQPILPLPAGTTGVILKTLVDGGYGVLRPELVEAILPAQ